MSTIAICRSPYHLELLRCNSELLMAPLTVLMLGRGDASDDVVYIGEESKAPSPSTWKKNKDYYDRVVGEIESRAPSKIIIFNNYTPLSKLLLRRIPLRCFELWEDGLNHYIHEHNGATYFLKSIVKSMLGYYPGESLRIYSEAWPEVRDRFIKRNLYYPVSDVYSPVSPMVFIGQPLVEDGMVSKAKFESGMNKLHDYLGGKSLLYLPHPREKLANEFVAPFVGSGWRVADLRSQGFGSAEQYLKSVGCRKCISAFSTVNFNVSLSKKDNILIPSFMGLNRIKDKLQRMNLEAIEVL